MQFINPIEILGLSNSLDGVSIDNEIIKKEKRKLFADIELSDDGLYNYFGIKLTKGDCEKAIGELKIKNDTEYYLYLANNKPLNEFLINGNPELFLNFQQDSIFKLPDFVKFISTYFAPKFDKALFIAFENENLEQTKKILNTSALISQSDINLAFKTVSNSIQSRIDEIDKITRDIKNEESIYTEIDIDDVVKLVKKYFPTQTLNCFPQYFQSQILKIANSVNYLNVAIWSNFDDTQVCCDLLEHILTLNIGGLDKPTFEKNFQIARKKNEKRKQEGNFAPILKNYASFIIESKNKIEAIKNKTIRITEIKFWIEENINIITLNNLEPEFNEIKNQIAITLKILSVEVYNNTSDLDFSIYLIKKADSINNVEATYKKIITDAKEHLNKIKNEESLKTRLNTRIQIPEQTRSNSSSKPDNTGCLWGVIIVVLIVIVSTCNSNKNNIEAAPAVDTTAVAVDTAAIAVDTAAIAVDTAAIDYTAVAIDTSSIDSSYNNIGNTESPYFGNQLKNGSSPLDNCFGRGEYNGKATLTIKNGGASDAIICLYSISEDRTIRNEYVQKNSNFKMSNIAGGDYKIRVLYGNDWNPNLINNCNSNGNFESDVNFSEFDGTEYFEDSERGHTIATITLYAVKGGNASSSSIDQSNFFKK